MSKIDKLEHLKQKQKEHIEKQKKQLEELENRKEIKKVKNVISDFKKFAMKGNIVDMATGVIIGTAFTKIVNSLVSEIITPLLSKLTGTVNYTDMFLVLGKGHFSTLEEAKAAGAITLNYGVFISNVIDFLIIAFTMFIFLRYTFNKRTKVEDTPKEPEAPTSKKCPFCITEIDINASRCPHCTSILEENHDTV